jgi:hypothetical protein
MIGKNELLQKLAPFRNYQVIVSRDQSVGEIIDGILATHEKYKSEYDKISSYFIGDSEIETAQNIWNFLKSEVPYYIEDTSKQTLRSPSAIIAMPGDCKSYALFSNGILDSLNRKGITKTPLAYRFASYRENNKEVQHVFSVMNPGTIKEIWIDPVLKRFNEHKEPTYFKDKKIKMALIALSGIGNNTANRAEQLEAFRDKLVNERDRLLVNGQLTPGSSKELEYKVAINKVTKAIQNEGSGISGFGDIGNQVKNFGAISGGLFKFGENKLRDQMQIFIEQYPTAFLYLFLPVGNSGINNWGSEFGWNQSPAVPGVPQIVQEKRNKAQQTYWDWGMPTGLQAETEIIGMIRDAITKKIGMSPESYWSKKLGVNISTKANNIIGYDAATTAVLDSTIPGSAEVLSTIGPIIDSLVPDLTWTHPVMEFTPTAEDWQSSIYANKFPLNQPATTLAPGGTTPNISAGMNIYVTLALVGAAIYMVTKMKK